jgi:DNA-binding PadR family transcriptional regulator
MWGYKIKKQAETKFGVKLRHGTLYPLLNALEQKSFLTSQKQQQGGRTRKVYTLTSKGQQYIEAYNNILKKQLEGQDIE